MASNNTNNPHRNNDTLMSQTSPFKEALGLQDSTVIDPTTGGDQFGFAGDYFGYLQTEPHVPQQAFCIVTSTPGIFNRLPHGAMLSSLLRTFLETRSQSFEGIREQVEYEYGTLKWGGRTLSVPIGANRNLGTVSHSGPDSVGEPFTHMFRTWGEWGIMNTDIRYPKIILLDDPGDLLLDDRSFSACYIEPTRNFRDVAHVAMLVGGMPVNTVPIEISRNKEESKQIRTIQMEFTGLLEVDTLACKEIGRILLKQLPLYNPDAVAAPEGFKERTAVLESSSRSGLLNRMIEQKSRLSDTVDGNAYYG